MGDTPTQPKQPEGMCKFSLFVFTLVLCFVLGAVLVVVPVLTFKESDTMKKVDFSTDLQFVFRQSEKFDSIVFKASQPNGTGVYVFKKGYEKKLKSTSGQHYTQSKTLEQNLGTGESGVAEIYYMPKSFLEVEALGEEGCSFTFEMMDYKQYKEFKKKNTVITMSADTRGSKEFYTNHTYDTYGVNYLVLTNKGKPGLVVYSVRVETPVYDLNATEAVAHCMNKSTCDLQSLPRDYFAIANIHVSDNSKMNVITITQIYNDNFRWTFPILIYALLVVIIICDIIIYCACSSVARKRGVSGYSSISDPVAINS